MSTLVFSVRRGGGNKGAFRTPFPEAAKAGTRQVRLEADRGEVMGMMGNSLFAVRINPHH